MKQETWLRLLGELRKRLITILLIVAAGAVFCYLFIDQVRNFLIFPASTSDFVLLFKTFISQFPRLELPPGAEMPMKIIYLTPGEAFMANLRLSLICGVLVTLPFIIYQLVALILAVTGNRRSFAFILTLAIYILFLLGLFFAYFVVFPFAMNFFLSFSAEDLTAEFSISRYFSFATSFLFAFGLVFQIPLVSWFLGSIGVINASFLRRNRKFAIVIILIIAAVLTPPDVFSQILMAIPLLILYECGILLVSFAQRRRAGPGAKAVPPEP